MYESGSLYCFIGYLLERAKNVNKSLYMRFVDQSGNVIFDDVVIGRDQVDGITTQNNGTYQCLDITRDIDYGYNLSCYMK